MKFNFKIQDYQTDAVDAVVDCFEGQIYSDGLTYRRDLGDLLTTSGIQASVTTNEKGESYLDEDLYDTGFKNEKITLSPNDLLSNIKEIQQNNNLKLSNNLLRNIGACTLDIEMETGTGKTYVYTKTMYELNQKYGWSKFIIVVPSIAIREGVKKSLEMTEDHFMEQYNKKIRYFIYDSKNLNQLDSFSSNSGINVMIINMQAFNTSLKEGGRSKDARIIYSKRDGFGSRRPIDVIAANNPILILDEPQKMEGKATQKALQNFNPLFALNYSATHKTQHNLVYALDAVDAYNQRLVKKIEVKGIEVKNLRGTDGYLYLDDIILSPKEPPKARIELEIGHKGSIKRESRILSVDDNLYEISKNMDQYQGYRISEIDPREAKVSFTNGVIIKKGEVLGDISEKDIRRIQIRETIKSHFEKEEKLFNQGIKTLSLFFIDEVAKYRQYDEDGNPGLGEYGKMFNEEYQLALNEYITLFDTPYQKYLKSINAEDTHKGYFSIDKNGKLVDGKIKKTTGMSDDISAYDLILKNKERLLSFDEPTRFIFSHSALREGWDNPNVFQICTLKQGQSTTMKRQEVGRGLRLAVDKDGTRMDANTLGKSEVHKLNKLTVVASESYKEFAQDLQKEIKENLTDRPRSASSEYFEGKNIKIDGQNHEITKEEAKIIYLYLAKNDYVSNDGKDRITNKYHDDLENKQLAPLPESLVYARDGIEKLIQSVFDDKVLDDMLDDANKTKVFENELNDNFYKKEFQDLWSKINHKYTYTVSFNSDELVEKAVNSIDDKLFVSKLQYSLSTSEQKEDITREELAGGNSFNPVTTSFKNVEYTQRSQIKYDMVGKIAENTNLTRKTVVKILKGIRSEKFSMYKNNPEEFFKEISRLIREQKATMIVEHIYYDKIEDEYDASIFTAEKNTTIDKAYKAQKHIQPYVFTDGTAEESIERTFAKDLDSHGEVCVYAKLPRGFKIPTPVGNYSPDWAIAFNEGSVKHIYFIAETKGSMRSMDLRAVEKAKIDCAKKLFNEISTEDVVYHEVDSYESLIGIMPTL
ncbi:type III restriction-modification system endonuclease [Anaerococcus vaginimassiliensis]|uniref:type III restriction-modification system endonuclease n=1 Tax=Anaerococcus vaginimassiliensis TaxID=2042308 RepID=UPI001030D8F5|nr:DEAD/DEAH box helicase family protein [Anaerococcus vaginimassiliensis]